MAAHAKLSPSSASRWLTCTPSANLEANFPDSAGEAAKEGTLAHTIAEIKINARLESKPGIFFSDTLQLIENEDPLWSPSMDEYTDEYVSFVFEKLAEARTIDPAAKLFTEERLDLTEYIPEGFGTGDVAIVADHTMYVIDLKYGKGVPVSSVDNKQMKVYALGWIEAYGVLFDIETVEMTIYQPRIGNISTWSITVQELFDWAHDELIPRAQMAFNGEGEFVAGSHCGFCKAKAQCRALAQYNLEIAKHEFKLPDLLTDEEISDILVREEMFTGWINSVSKFALDQALAGKKWPHFKLVEGRSVRKINDQAGLIKELEGLKFQSADYMKPAELKSMTDLEKLVGKKTFTEKMSGYIVKPPGKPTLVHESDKRPEINSVASAQADFAD